MSCRGLYGFVCPFECWLGPALTKGLKTCGERPKEHRTVCGASCCWLLKLGSSGIKGA